MTQHDAPILHPGMHREGKAWTHTEQIGLSSSPNQRCCDPEMPISPGNVRTSAKSVTRHRSCDRAHLSFEERGDSIASVQDKIYSKLTFRLHMRYIHIRSPAHLVLERVSTLTNSRLMGCARWETESLAGQVRRCRLGSHLRKMIHTPIRPS